MWETGTGWSSEDRSSHAAGLVVIVPDLCVSFKLKDSDACQVIIMNDPPHSLLTDVQQGHLTLSDVHTSGSPLSPIDRLPPEILAELYIFCACVDPISPVALSHVCRTWRNVIYDWPRVWHNLVLNQELLSVPSLQKQSELWIARSSPLSFDVEVDLVEIDTLLPILSPLLPHIYRWRRYKARGNWCEDVPLSGLYGWSSSSRLNRMEITINEDIAAPSALPYIPSQSTFQLVDGHFTMNLVMTDLPQEDCLIAPMRLTTLIIDAPFTSVNPIKMLHLLTSFPELQCLRVAGVTLDFEMSYDCNSVPVVSLPHLNHLTLKGTHSARGILSHFDTPALRELHLAHLNVDHQLFDLFENEPGDSDDEAQDYSQSPFSDCATGMGLRNLIRRCTPPITVLCMDYADMRTKDFQWCFDRLEKLEAFSIVASDMSDKVIRLLAPFRIDTAREAWGGRADSDDWLIVRLPHLKTLSLHNCQRLSGVAILDAISARVAFTDHRMRMGDENFSSLDRMEIFDCDGFEGRSRQSLTHVLGTRLVV